MAGSSSLRWRYPRTRAGSVAGTPRQVSNADTRCKVLQDRSRNTSFERFGESAYAEGQFGGLCLGKPGFVSYPIAIR